jgi:ribosomal protein L17
MNEQEIVSQMITFIEEKERQLQNNRLATDNQQRNNVVQSILDELERVTDQ